MIICERLNSVFVPYDILNTKYKTECPGRLLPVQETDNEAWYGKIIKEVSQFPCQGFNKWELLHDAVSRRIKIQITIEIHGVCIRPLKPVVCAGRNQAREGDGMITHIYNEGGPLAAGHAHLSVKESGGAHITSQSVPALGHDARTTVTLKAGTQSAYRSKIPGRHVLRVNISVNGKTTTTKVTRAFRPGTCQLRHSEVLHHSDMRMHIKLNPQPEPPSRR